MRSMVFIMLLTLICASEINGQTWFQSDIGLEHNNPYSMKADTVDGWFYLMGDINWVDGHKAINILRLDKNGAIDFMDTVHPFIQTPRDIIRFQDTLIVVGDRGVGRYVNSQWDTIFFGSGRFLSVIEHQNQMIIGGIFSKISTTYDGSVNYLTGHILSPFHNIHQIIDVKISTIETMKWYKNKLYIGGNIFGTPNINEVFSWDGVNWDDMKGGLPGNSGFEGVADMEIYKDELYVAGYFSVEDGSIGNSIMRWDGTNWKSVGKGLFNGTVNDLHVFDDRLWAVGYFDSAQALPVSHIAAWDGNFWCRPEGEFCGEIYCIADFNDTLYVGGHFNCIDGDSTYHKLVKLNPEAILICQDSSVGITDEYETQLSVYPNPNEGVVRFSKMISGKIFLIDIRGKVCFTQELNCAHHFAIPEDVSNGLYIMNLMMRDQISSHRLLIHR